ncbi:amiloride-sensitive sodium channel domain-containing protein [Phthorimaea operculella]|nr:amiloride-sensitive sodium channel domain-containing protein [Phthorimaea operculella]
MKKTDNQITLNKVKDEDNANVHYLREFYIKDFEYISPTIININEIQKVDEKKMLDLPKVSCRSLFKLWLTKVMAGLKQFLYEGSLHGVKYIFEPTFTRKERAVWIIIMLISVGICSAVIIQLFSMSRASPFVNVIDSLPSPVWSIPFPAVVICPHLRLQLSKYNVTELDELHKYFASMVCPLMAGENAYLAERMSADDNIEMMDFLVKGSPKCQDVVKRCYWRGTSQIPRTMTTECCDSFFKPIFTGYGLCFTFNGLPLNGMTNVTIPWQKSFNAHVKSETIEWDLDRGYPKVIPSETATLPHRVMASGEVNGLGIELYLNISEHQNACDGNSLGFNIIISSPADHVYTSTVLRIPMNRMTTVEVTPITYKTDTNLRSLTPDVRQCFFQNERSLEYYEFYTDNNCKHDLLIREAVQRCNCVMYNWPRKEVSGPVCSTRLDFDCIEGVRATVEKQLIDAYFDDSEEQRRPKSSSSSCHPSCNNILYSSQVFYSDWVKEPSEDNPDWGNPNPGEVTKINVHFYNDMFLGQHRHMQYDDYYFIGAIGGLLSLFLGFSIISVAELLYFVILRPIQAVIKEQFCY